MEKGSLKTMKKSSPRWDASTYVAEWHEAVALLNDKNFILNILQRMNLPDDASILEIGGGSCKWSAAFSIMGYKVTAIDNNPEMLEQGKQNFPNLNIEYVLDDLLNLFSEASKRKYELVFNEGVLEHFLDRNVRISAIKAMGNCCIEGGYVYFLVPFLSDKPDEHRYTSVKEMYDEVIAASLETGFIDIMTLHIVDKNSDQTRRKTMLRVVARKR